MTSVSESEWLSVRAVSAGSLMETKSNCSKNLISSLAAASANRLNRHTAFFYAHIFHRCLYFVDVKPNLLHIVSPVVFAFGRIAPLKLNTVFVCRARIMSHQLRSSDHHDAES
jgi:hypothetical protein